MSIIKSMFKNDEIGEIMGPKKITSTTKLSNPSSSKTTPTKTKNAGKAVTPKKGAPVKSGAKTSKAPTSKTVAKGTPKGKDNTPTKKSPKKALTKEDIAAIKIQTFVRHYLAKCKLEKLKKQKQEYNELIEKLQRQAWLDIIQRQREEDEAQRLKDEEERKRKREELKWRKDFLEGAFDGDVDSIKNILKQAENRTRTSSSLSGDGLERLIQRNRLNLVECEDANENSALSEASAGGNVDTVVFLLENGASINHTGHFRRTPIYRAAFGGHLEVLKMLLQHGGDPRITDSEGVLPEQVAAITEITECIQNWDISVTDTILLKLSEEKDKLIGEQQKLKQIEQEKNEKDILELETEYSSSQKFLQKAYEELNKRISEHDECVAQGFERPDITIQAIHDAEEHLLKAQSEEKVSRDKLAVYRLQVREQKTDDSEDDGTVKCHIKELDDVLMRDVGNKIKDSGRWPLLLDPSTQAVTFLKYRDTNYLNVLNPKDMDVVTLREALLGAIRYGKFLVLDMMEVNLFNLLETRCDDIQPNLYKELITKDILKDHRYYSLIRPTDGKEYAKENFVEMRVERFMLLIVTKFMDVPKDLMDTFYAIKIVTPAMS